MEATTATKIIEQAIAGHRNAIVRRMADAVRNNPKVIAHAEAAAAMPTTAGIEAILRNDKINALGALMTRVARQAAGAI